MFPSSSLFVACASCCCFTTYRSPKQIFHSKSIRYNPFHYSTNHHHHHRQPSSLSSSSSSSKALSLQINNNNNNNPTYPSTTNTIYPYDPPPWAKAFLRNFPKHGKLSLGHLQTPIHKLQTTNPTTTTSDRSSIFPSIFQNNNNISLYIKRDDMTGGVEIGGNKIRKLEFLLADAISQNYNSILTIGGEQSNHCRATACACRMVSNHDELVLEPHLILRTKRANRILMNKKNDKNKKEEEEEKKKEDFGFVGNILLDRIVGSTIYTCTPGEYGRMGSNALLKAVSDYIESKSSSSSSSKKVYPIPVGGSNALGSWGFLNAVDEVLHQWHDNNNNNHNNKKTLDHIVFACGSGGTAAGIVLGMALAHCRRPRPSENENENDNNEFYFPQSNPPIIHAIGVCDDPDYFYKEVTNIANELQLIIPPIDDETMSTSSTSSSSSTTTTTTTTEEFIRKHMIVHQGKGLGYGINTPEELHFITNFAISSGIVLDPVYSGKALYHFLTNVITSMEYKHLFENNKEDDEQNILFWHTGGTIGLYDKGYDLLDMTLNKVSIIKRLDLYGKHQKNNNNNNNDDDDDDGYVSI